MKIYGIYEGCDHEGGGIGDFFYNDKGRAILDAQNLVLKEKVKNNRNYKEVESNIWKCGSDVIQVIERDLIISHENTKVKTKGHNQSCQCGECRLLDKIFN